MQVETTGNNRNEVCDQLGNFEDQEVNFTACKVFYDKKIKLQKHCSYLFLFFAIFAQTRLHKFCVVNLFHRSTFKPIDT